MKTRSWQHRNHINGLQELNEYLYSLGISSIGYTKVPARWVFRDKAIMYAHTGYPLMGMALYPPLAQMAGLGQLGVSGLLITPEHGPRVRLAALFTDIENLPFNDEPNAHSWVLDYCAQCQICVKKCPKQAIYTHPLTSNNGLITCVDNDRCFPYFMETEGCAVCIKVCPFNTASYSELHVSACGNREI